MATFSFAEARACVLAKVQAAPAAERIATLAASGRVLAEDILADRDYPPIPRSVRDGFAVRATGGAANLQVIGEVRAGESFAGQMRDGQAIEIMTGAPMPSGADAVVMVEHALRTGDRISFDRAVTAGDFVNHAGSEAVRGDVVLVRGRAIDYTGIAMAATFGRTHLSVYKQPSVSILPTGDELVAVEDTPAPYQVRNSNAWSIAAQVRRAGGVPSILPVARDEEAATRMLLEQAFDADLVLLSGGVSAGKYDLVEKVLAQMGAEFYFDRVRIQPGQPLVFGKCAGKFFFGLPGNPGSTMVTFELFARAALERLAGITTPLLPLAFARLCKPFKHRTGLTRFLPALLNDGNLTPIASKGSSDVPALARANAFLVADEDREAWDAGDMIRTLLK